MKSHSSSVETISAIDSSLALARSYLRNQTVDGSHWTGFPTLAGTSDCWVTGFLVSHIAAFAPKDRQLVSARQYLASQFQKAEGGWGYSMHVPVDADSTAWCLLALSGCSTLSTDKRRMSESLLEKHFNGFGICTYRAEHGIRDFIEAGPEISTDGWTQAHLDVTAAALLTKAFARSGADAEAALQWLMGAQSPAGVLPSYWWRGQYYASVMTLRACLHHKFKPQKQFVKRLRELLLRKQLADGGFALGGLDQADAFSTAIALECMHHLNSYGLSIDALSTTNCVLQMQRDDGGWVGDSVMRIPACHEIDPDGIRHWSRGTGGGNSFVADTDGLFATVLCAHSLDLRKQQLTGESEKPVRATWTRLKRNKSKAIESVVVIPNPLPENAEGCL